jgi:hypothetical protein
MTDGRMWARAMSICSIDPCRKMSNDGDDVPFDSLESEQTLFVHTREHNLQIVVIAYDIIFNIVIVHDVCTLT